MTLFAEKQRITWAPEKCVFLSKQPLLLNIDGTPLPQEQHFKYLGVIISADGIKPNEHIKRLRANTLAKMEYMRSVGITALGGNLRPVINLYKAFLWPSMEYGLEICLPNKKLIETLERCQGTVLRAILGLPKGTSYAAMILFCGLDSMEHRWRKSSHSTSTAVSNSTQKTTSSPTPLHQRESEI
ncbi:hypothetical protein BX070DRAFT_188028 [Coemansia spiralis]|nr:hypothetical protein BX070DRAFT_188028 [Coemansia spiralis]